MKKNLKHYTSANLDSDFLDQIHQISEFYNIPEGMIFKDLIKLTVKNNKRLHVYGILTEYQDHSPQRWEKLNYFLENTEIEDFGKIRQKYKISISKFAFIGFLLFMDLLIYMYKERLKKSIKITCFNSYLKVQEKYKKYINKFKIRLNILQKE